MNAEQPAPPATTAHSPSEQVAARQVSQRRWRVVRGVLTFLGITCVLIVLSALMRENQAIEACRHRMQIAVAELQQLRNAGELPIEVPPSTDESFAVWKDHVFSNWRYSDYATTAGKAGVCACQSPHVRLFRPDGRHVIVYDAAQGRYSLLWVTEPEFDRLADELGLHQLRPR